MDDKFVQSVNAKLPIDVTVSGIVIFPKVVQLANAYSSMDVAPVGITPAGLQGYCNVIAVTFLASDINSNKEHTRRDDLVNRKKNMMIQ